MAYEAFDEEPQDRGGGGVRFLVGLVVGALVVGAIWLGQWSIGPRDDPDPDSSSSSTAAQAPDRDEPGSADQHAEHTGNAAASQDSASDEADDGEARSEEADGDVRDRCEEVFDAQEAPLQAAARSLGQWEIHVGAMNQLVAGTISVRQARRFWEQTRAGARQRLERYDDAMNEWRERLVRCPGPEHVARGDGQLRCARAVAARAATIRAAATSVETWRVHVHHMEMLRDGEITPQAATREWLASWRKGDRELASYAANSRRAASVTC